MVSIVLCRPEGSANIGAVCRAMKTMNLASLMLVAPAVVAEEEVKKWSLKAFDIYQSATKHASLSSAISSAAWIVGVSRRQGKNRKKYFLTPEDMAKQLAIYSDREVCLVFGNEKNGLCEEELKLCHSLLTIPSDEEYGSLNLSHAVQICAYAIFSSTKEHNLRQLQSVSQPEIERMVGDIVERMDERGIFTARKPGIKRLTYSRLYDIFGRVPLHSSDIKFLRHTLDKMIYAERSDVPKAAATMQRNGGE